MLCILLISSTVQFYFRKKVIPDRTRQLLQLQTAHALSKCLATVLETLLRCFAIVVNYNILQQNKSSTGTAAKPEKDNTRNPPPTLLANTAAARLPYLEDRAHAVRVLSRSLPQEDALTLDRPESVRV